MIVTLVSAYALAGVDYIRVSAAMPNGVQIYETAIPSAAFSGLTAPQKRQLILNTLKAQLQPPQPVQLGFADIGANVGDSIDLGP